MNFQKLQDSLGVELIQITFTIEEYSNFLFLQGLAIGEISKTDKELAASLLQFVDKMNSGNPDWDSYFKREGEENEKG